MNSRALLAVTGPFFQFNFFFLKLSFTLRTVFLRSMQFEDATFKNAFSETKGQTLNWRIPRASTTYIVCWKKNDTRING